MSDRIKVRTEIYLSEYEPPLCAEVQVDRLIAESFRPLPRDREIIPSSRREAENQDRDRRQLARIIGDQIAQMIYESIVEAIESGDPQMGYSPEEWRRITERSGG